MQCVRLHFSPFITLDTCPHASPLSHTTYHRLLHTISQPTVSPHRSSRLRSYQGPLLDRPCAPFSSTDYPLMISAPVYPPTHLPQPPLVIPACRTHFATLHHHRLSTHRSSVPAPHVFYTTVYPLIDQYALHTTIYSTCLIPPPPPHHLPHRPFSYSLIPFVDHPCLSPPTLDLAQFIHSFIIRPCPLMLHTSLHTVYPPIDYLCLPPLAVHLS